MTPPHANQAHQVTRMSRYTPSTDIPTANDLKTAIVVELAVRGAIWQGDERPGISKADTLHAN